MNIFGFVTGATRPSGWSLQKRLGCAFGLMLMPLIVVGLTGWVSLRDASTSFAKVSSQVSAEAPVQERLRSLIAATDPLAPAYVTQRDRKALTEFRQNADEIERTFAKLAELYAAHGRSIGTAPEKWRRARADAERGFGLRLLPADDPSVPYPIWEFHRLGSAAGEELAAQQRDGFARIEAEAEAVRERQRYALFVLLGVFALSAAAAAVIAGRLGHAILVPIQRLEEAASRIGDGDLSARVDVARNDELGHVSRTFNAMSERLEDSRDSRAQLEERLRQAQKMEAVGRLAGGIAHDFNNLLMAIRGYCELLLHGLGSSSDEKTMRQLKEIAKAADRSVSLTGQLLAFSRRQILQPEILDPNLLVAGISEMLLPLIGEDIRLTTKLAQDLGRIEADPTQVEQIVMNLALNARDAMPAGGDLIIETANVVLDETYALRHGGVEPGRYVMLAVSDTGEGMDAQTRERIFEPFFTTKGVGKGTGLGLATVYGIVKQSGGSIYVYSEAGVGTTFKVYLPHTDQLPLAAPRHTDEPTRTGAETILLVEDDDVVRNLTAEMLELHGYHVLAAADGDEALEVEASREEPIDLLVTDVVMPGMNGAELATRLATQRPQLKVIFASGYTDEAIVHHGVLDQDVVFLPKPFTMSDLGKKVREVLDEPAALRRKAS